MFSRPTKLSHLETVIYEIDMLRFSRNRLLKKARNWSKPDEYVYLESFLVHYRNLIEFFRGQPKTRFPDDLSVSKPEDWAGNKNIEASVIASLTNSELYEKYEGPDKTETISKYLHHCTKRRAERDKDWDVEGMYAELEDVLLMFEKLFPELPPVVADVAPPYVTSTEESVSTASIRSFKSGAGEDGFRFPEAEDTESEDKK